jgi:hypothetical protein
LVALMVTVHFQDWGVVVDREATAEAYAQIEASGSDLCGCQDCRNFVAVRDAGLLYPPAVLELLAQLGVDPSREAESASMGSIDRDHPDVHLYEWWFNVIGHLLPGELTQPRDPARELQLYPVSGGALADAAFGDAPLFRVEFLGGLPWLLDEASWQVRWNEGHRR